MSIAQNIRPAAWQTKILSAVIIGFASLGASLSPSIALGADAPPVVNDKFANLDAAIAELRSEVGKDRRAIVKANMLLTNSEATVFWPLYDEYRGERNKIGDRRWQLVSDFLSKRDAMSEDDAQDLTKESISIDKDKISVKQKYISKMSKVLSARTVARFFQIDSKLDAAVDLAIAARIPLIY